MKTIAISGVIGWDVIPDDIRAKLEEAGGEDITVEVSSPGGFVTDGLEIFNLIKNYKGNKTTLLMGMAASMASYIVLAGDKVVAEDNAIFMVHNVWGFAVGDHRELRKSADVQEGMTRLLSKAYIRKTGKTEEEIRNMMDEETYLFGDEILDAGFVDEVVPAGDGAEDKDSAITMAQIAMNKCKKTMEEKQEKNQLEKAAAMLGEIMKKNSIVDRGKSGVAGDNTAAMAEPKKEEVKTMTLDELKQEFSGVYAEAVNIGVEQERKRVMALRSYIEADPDNMKLAEVVNTAIAGGQTVEEVNAKLQVAIRDGGKTSGENPPDVQTAAAVEDLSQEDIEAAKLAGMTLEEYRKAMKESE